MAGVRSRVWAVVAVVVAALVPVGAAADAGGKGKGNGPKNTTTTTSIATTSTTSTPTSTTTTTPPQPRTASDTAPWVSSSEGVSPYGACQLSDVCDRDADPTTGDVEATVLYASADGSRRSATVAESIEAVVNVAGATTIDVTSEVDLARADALTTVAAGRASCRLGAFLTVWRPGGWTYVSPITVFADAADGSSQSAVAGGVAVRFHQRLPYRTTGEIHVRVTFIQEVTADSSGGGAGAASALFDATVQEVRVVYV